MWLLAVERVHKHWQLGDWPSENDLFANFTAIRHDENLNWISES
jgi:hypothetical protein